MELRELAAFREVARNSSFSRAAVRLGYVQSTVSAQVQALEQELGARLFDRLARSVALTAAGEALLPHAERMLDVSDEARAAVATAMVGDHALSGTIAVSAPESLLTYRLPGILSRFRHEHPGVTIDLRATPIGRFRGDTRRALAAGTVDFAFVLDVPLNLAGFEVTDLTRESISVIAAPGHRLVGSTSVGPTDFIDESILLPEAPDIGCAYRGQFEHQLANAGVDTHDALEFASIETVKQCVAAGMGVSVVPSVAIEADLAAGRLVRLPWGMSFDVHTQLVRNARRSVSPAQAAFSRVSREALGAAAEGHAQGNSER